MSKENRSHTFLPELSGNLKEDDVVIVPNVVLLSGIFNAKSLGFLAEILFKGMLVSSKPKEFQNLTAESFFHGYNDDFVNLITKFRWDLHPQDIGMLSYRRGVTKKSLTIFTGTDDIEKVGGVFSVNNQTKLGIWKSESCDVVKGSEGAIFGPSLAQNKKDLLIYVPDFCRSMPLEFKQETQFDGMRSYLYKAADETFSTPESYPENKYYCELKSVKAKHIDGILDVSSCFDGNPMFISHPHFREGDEKLFQHFEGLHPNASLHTPFLYIHPRLSVPIFGSTKLQLSIRVNHFGSYYKNIPNDIILPLAWFDRLTDEYPDDVKFKLFLSTVVVDFTEMFFKFGCVISFLLSALYLIFYNISNCKKNVTSPQEIVNFSDCSKNLEVRKPLIQ